MIHVRGIVLSFLLLDLVWSVKEEEKLKILQTLVTDLGLTHFTIKGSFERKGPIVSFCKFLVKADHFVNVVEDKTASGYISINEMSYSFENNSVFEHYQIKSKQFSNRLGNFQANKFIWQAPKNGVIRRSNLKGVLLRFIGIPFPNWFELPKHWEKSVKLNSQVGAFDVTDLVQGFSVDAVKLFAEKLNFKVQIFRPVDDTFGNYDEATKNATGLVKLLVEGKVDMTLFGMNSDRAKVLQFIHPIALPSSFAFTVKSKA